ncbi:hypothetical protein Pmani_039172 [Petrolisthes manimaculis]|uniref:Uncharacterized protein n=1 Tax=Petrolisthes manimaculis TaxID=1843537 RepID=A0AAE1ND11_9EUCA|nr:hypothetical protein Pmani_039172 [Petrolisthes manimaculis]
MKCSHHILPRPSPHHTITHALPSHHHTTTTHPTDHHTTTTHPSDHHTSTTHPTDHHNNTTHSSHHHTSTTHPSHHHTITTQPSPHNTSLVHASTHKHYYTPNHQQTSKRIPLLNSVAKITTHISRPIPHHSKNIPAAQGITHTSSSSSSTPSPTQPPSPPPPPHSSPLPQTTDSSKRIPLHTPVAQGITNTASFSSTLSSLSPEPHSYGSTTLSVHTPIYSARIINHLIHTDDTTSLSDISSQVQCDTHTLDHNVQWRILDFHHHNHPITSPLPPLPPPPPPLCQQKGKVGWWRQVNGGQVQPGQGSVPKGWLLSGEQVGRVGRWMGDRNGNNNVVVADQEEVGRVQKGKEMLRTANVTTDEEEAEDGVDAMIGNWITRDLDVDEDCQIGWREAETRGTKDQVREGVEGGGNGIYGRIIEVISEWITPTPAPPGTSKAPEGGTGAEPGEWERPLSNLAEVISAMGLLCGTFDMAQVLWLSSSVPLSPALVRQALTLVARRVTVLQMCVQWRWMWPWYRRMRRMVVDMSVVHDDDPKTVCYRQLRSGYRASRGPLWRAALVPLPQSGEQRYHAALVLNIHHAITDGTTNMLISRDILQTLNALVTGKRQETPFRSLVTCPKATTCKDWVHGLKFILSAIKTALINAFNSSSLLRHLPRPTTNEALTKVIQNNFSVETTERLLRSCKQTGVRVDSCIMAIANIALFRTVQKYSPKEIESLKIIHERAINIRRYFDAQHQEAVGSMAFLNVQDHVVSNLDSHNIWNLARCMQEKLDRCIQVKKPLRTSSLGWLCAALIPLNLVLSKLGWINFTFSHINSTNMGNLQHLLPARYDSGPVEVTELLRTTAAELAGSIFTLACQTLDHRLLTSLDYYTNRVREDVARDFFAEFVQSVQEVAWQNNDLVVSSADATS